MQRLPFQLYPEKGESLVGYIIRSAEENFYTTPQLLNSLRHRPISQHQPYVFFGNYSRISELTGLTFRQIRRMHLYEYRDPTPWPVPFITSQQSVDRCLLGAPAARFAPTPLMKKAFHRLLWDLNFLSVDIESGEYLQSTCPSCDQKLDWEQRTITNCHHCGFDFRDANSEYADDVTLEINLRLAMLFSRRRSIRQEARKNLPHPINEMNITELILTAHWLGLKSDLSGQTEDAASDDLLRDIKYGLKILETWNGMPPAIFERIVSEAEHKSKTSAAFLWNTISVCKAAATPFLRAALRDQLAAHWDVSPSALNIH